MNQYVPTVSQKIVSIILPPKGMVLALSFIGDAA
jgi:hypothetical protein